MTKYTAKELGQLAREFNHIQFLTRSAQTRQLNTWEAKTLEDCEDVIQAFIDSMPSGSGFDSPPSIVETSQVEIILNVPFHILNDVGYYVGWVNYQVRIYPQFDDLNIDVNLTDEFDNVYNEDLSELKELGESSIEYISDVYWELFGE